MNVLVSGAGIAGPALGFWLARYGHRVTIVEHAPAVRPGGYKVDLRGAAIDVADRMGLLGDIRAASTDIHLATFVNPAGRPLATLGAEFFAGRVDGDDEVMRGDLAHLLYQRTRDQVEYLFNDSIEALEQHDDGVRVSFRNAPPRDFSVVVGADGLHSHTRRLVFGPEEHYARHLGAYVSIFSAPNHLELDHRELFCYLPGRVVNIYSARQNTEARNLFIFTAPPSVYPRDDVAAQKRLVAEHFADGGWEVPRMLEHMWQADDFYLDSCSLIEMDTWSRGRVTLLGDAAYCASPLSGQGTGLALVGAYVLAGELATAADPRAALDAYERRMRSYVAMNQKFGEDLAKRLPARRLMVWLQGLTIRTLPYAPWKNFIARKITEEMQAAANGITLPDYAGSRGLAT